MVFEQRSLMNPRQPRNPRLNFCAFCVSFAANDSVFIRVLRRFINWQKLAEIVVATGGLSAIFRVPF